MNKKVRTINDYRVVYLPGHVNAMTSKNWNGWVYEHIAIASNFAKRQIKKTEVVHHLDGNRRNNRLENLLILDRGQHGRMHGWITKGCPYDPSTIVEQKTCLVCNIMLQKKQKDFCSLSCHGTNRYKIQWPNDEILKKDWEKFGNFSKLAKIYDCSNNGLKKRLKKLGII